MEQMMMTQVMMEKQMMEEMEIQEKQEAAAFIEYELDLTSGAMAVKLEQLGYDAVN